DHATFLQVAAAMPEVCFAAIGQGTESLRCPANVKRLGVRLDMPALYAAADCLISTSLFGEGFSNVIAEAVASEIAVVATDVGDAREILGDSGFVVPPGSAAAIIHALRSALRENPDQRRQSAHARRERLASRFSVARAVTSFDALYAGGVSALA